MKIKKVSGKFYFVLWLTEVCELFSHSVIPDLNSAVTFGIMSDKNKRNLSDISLPYSDVATKKTREGSLNNLTLNNSVMEGVSQQPGAPVCSSTPDTPDTHHPPTMLHHPPPPFGYPAQYFVNPQPLTLSSDDLQKIADVVSASVRASIREEVQDLIQQMVEPIRADVNLLRQENENLRLQLDELEQYGRRSLIRVSGIPETPEESTTEKLLEVTSSVGVALTSSDIVTSHRVGDPRKQRQSPRQIIVRLQSTDVKFSLMKEAKKLRKNSETRHIIINEDLTKYRDRLLYLCRQLCRERKLKQAWTSNGKISVRDFGDRTYAIRKESDLAPFGHVSKESGHS